MKVWTAQMAKHHSLKRNGIPFIDTTVKSGEKTFAPEWHMVNEYLAGTKSEEAYTAEFYVMMRKSFECDPVRWESVAKMDEIALLCYCKAGNFCHRLLLVEIFEKVCMHFGVPFEYCGEYV